MPVKMTGAQYKAFLATPWGPDAYWEEAEVTRNGSLVDDDHNSDPAAFSDVDEVEIIAGTIIPDQSIETRFQTEYVDAVKFARKWLKAQTTVTLMVEVPREDADAIALHIGGFHVEGRKLKIVGRIG